MKKWIKGLAIGVLAIGLAACSDTADVKPGTDESKKSELTIEEVFTKAQAASEKLESMHAKMEIEQNIASSAEGLNMDSKISVDMDMIQDPLQMHQIMDVDMGEMGTMKMELYMTEDGFYMQNPESDTWMKLPAALYEEVTGSLSGGADPTLDLASLEQFVEDFKFEQNDEEYILTLKASGEKFNELLQEELATTGMMEGINEEEADVLESMVIHQLDYEIFINKATFDTTAFNMVMDMELGPEGETVRITQDIKAKMSQLNDIKEIVVPQEIVENAVEQ